MPGRQGLVPARAANACKRRADSRMGPFVTGQSQPSFVVTLIVAALTHSASFLPAFPPACPLPLYQEGLPDGGGEGKG